MASEDERSSRPRTPGASNDDVVLVHGRTEDGKGLEVLRKRGDTLHLGQVRPLEDGKPLTGEVISLRPRPESPILFDVDVLHRPEGETRAGPAQVATDDYRVGWQTIWGGKGARGKRAAASKKDLN